MFCITRINSVLIDSGKGITNGIDQHLLLKSLNKTLQFLQGSKAWHDLNNTFVFLEIVRAKQLSKLMVNPRRDNRVFL